MKAKLILLSLFLLVTALTLTYTTYAAIPHLINFQGKATDKAGAPLNSADNLRYNLTFRIYNSETGGTPKWSETQANIPISNGIFQVQLGSVTPLNLPFDESYWISIEINTDGEMSPRTKLASVPYAYKAESLTDTPVIPFYKKGFDIEYVDFNSIKITPGVMDVAGKMVTTTNYSRTLQLEYADAPINRDWVHGSKTNSSFAYVYAYYNDDQIEFKFSDEAPNLSDQLGNTIQKPLLYQRYPDTANGVYHRCIGRVRINELGIMLRTESLTDNVPNGTILMWSGTIDSIPMGWILCDGTNGTPDLRDRFIVGARQDDGGVAKTNLIGSFTQSGNSNLASHTHAIYAGDGNGGSYVDSADNAHHYVNNTNAAGSGSETYPRYYALAFIMKS